MTHSNKITPYLWTIIERHGYAINFTVNTHEITVTLIGRYASRHFKAQDEKEMIFLLRPYLN